MDNIYLIGFMGCGKSSIGIMLEDVFKYHLIDMDMEIEKKYGKRISEIIQLHGENIFRHLETGMLYSIARGNKVVATGGGIVEKKANINYMKYNGYIIFLQASFENIENRLKNDTSRPLWNTDKETRKQLFERREKLYTEVSDYTVQTNHRTLEAISREIYLHSKSVL